MVTAKDLLRTDYVSVDVNDSISKLLGRLKLKKQHSAVVFDGKKYLGIIARRFLLISRINPKQMKVRNIIKHRSKARTPFFVPKLAPDTDLRKMAKLFATADTHMLPVIQKGKLIGIVSSHDLLKEVAKDYSGLACDELASMKAETATANDEIGKVMKIFNRKNIDHLPVVDKEGKLEGMITLSDLLMNPEFWGPTSGQHLSRAASHQKGKRSGYDGGEKTGMISLPVKNCMSRKTLCCTPPSTSIPEAVKMMDKNDVCNIILVKYNKPVGILTIKDLLKDYAK